MKDHELFSRIVNCIALELNEDFDEVREALYNLKSFDEVICTSLVAKELDLSLGDAVIERLTNDSSFFKNSVNNVRRLWKSPKYYQ